MKINNNKITVSVNRRMINKPSKSDFARLNKYFELCETTVGNLIESIRSGYTHSFVFSDNKRSSSNFASADVVMLDFDGTITITELLNHEWVKDYGAFVYTTPSHSAEQHRLRLVLILEDTVINGDVLQALMKGLVTILPQADKQCTDAARPFHGNTNAEVFEIGNILSNHERDRLIELGSPKPKPKSVIIQKKQTELKLGQDEIRKMLNSIDPKPGYEIWRNICWAVKSWCLANNLDDEIGLSLIEEWSPDDCGGMKIKKLFNDYRDSGIHIGTLIHLAKEEGYDLPFDYKKSRTAEQVAFEDVFNWGYGYITVKDKLYVYNDGYYQDIDDDKAKQLIAKYFHSYETENGKNKYAKTRAVEEALKYVKSHTNVDPNLVNPDGINLKNGFLTINESGSKLVAKLQKHSPQHFCLYKSGVAYVEDIETTSIKKILNDMLDEKDQKIVLGVIASSLFGLDRIKAKHGRTVKALFLNGQGANGKDVLRTWTSEILDNKFMSAISTDKFKGTNRFFLASIVGSKLNWPSENRSLHLDSSEILKACITGDTVEIEEKGKPIYSYNPKAGFIFNSNSMPYIGGQSEAIRSRFCVIEFPYVFTDKPDPKNKYHKPADPRLKNDIEYIRTKIAPAFLKLLIGSYSDVFNIGIDYTHCIDRMEDIIRDSDHFYEIIEYLEQCDTSEGLTASELLTGIHKIYSKLGYIKSGSFGKQDQFIEPGDYDKLVRSNKEVKRRIKKYFPNLKESKGSSGRKVGVKFSSNFDSIFVSDYDSLSEVDQDDEHGEDIEDIEGLPL